MQLTIMGDPIAMTDTQKDVRVGLERPIVSMCCITYNHVETIAQCLEGMLMQEVDVPVEIVVHDDASTDGTAEIVADYAVRYPSRIRAILRKENQFSQGKRPAALAFGEARGDYMALCEGDDFWTDHCKIAQQLAALEAEPEVDMCAHLVKIWDYRDGIKVNEYPCRTKDGLFHVGEVLEKRITTVPTPAVFIRRRAAEDFIKFVSTRPNLRFGDVYIKFFGALRNGVRILPECMAISRARSSGSWSEAVSLHPKRRIEEMSAKILGLSELIPLEPSIVKNIHIANKLSARRIALASDIPLATSVEFIWTHRRQLGMSATTKLIIHSFRARILMFC